MTMISFRADDDDVELADVWARRLHIDRSELLRDALRRHLAALAADEDAQAPDANRPPSSPMSAAGPGSSPTSVTSACSNVPIPPQPRSSPVTARCGRRARPIGDRHLAVPADQEL